MIVTGYDSVLLVQGPVEEAVRNFLDSFSARWPNMVVWYEGMPDEAFQPWPELRTSLPTGEAEVLVARDRAMEAGWDDTGYALVDGEEGPFMLGYTPIRSSSLRVLALDDPYSRDEGIPHEPYEAQLVGSRLMALTIVTPDEESDFSRSVLDGLTTALAAT